MGSADRAAETIGRGMGLMMGVLVVGALIYGANLWVKDRQRASAANNIRNPGVGGGGFLLTKWGSSPKAAPSYITEDAKFAMEHHVGTREFSTEIVNGQRVLVEKRWVWRPNR